MREKKIFAWHISDLYLENIKDSYNLVIKNKNKIK